MGVEERGDSDDSDWEVCYAATDSVQHFTEEAQYIIREVELVYGQK